MKKTIHLISAARPNYMKIAPLYHALKREEWADVQIVHTGQHYDQRLFADFFRELQLPEPHMALDVGRGSHAEQTASVMVAYERVLERSRPDLTVVVGDVNSTMAAALTAVKCGVPVAHLEAGLRSHDRSMPEEINRIVTDRISDHLWAPSEDAVDNLRHEGVPEERIALVGNSMIDSLELFRSEIEKRSFCQRMNLDTGSFGIITVHRPSNVDDRDMLARIVSALVAVSQENVCLFPIHPRTRKCLESYGLLAQLSVAANIRITEPIGYLDFMNALCHARFVITDSGGVQEETTYIGIPCLTLRANTERPVTITHGTNRLCDCSTLRKELRDALGQKRESSRIPLWDGKTAERIVEIIKTL